MPEKEKTWEFWFGLIILALASVALFSVIWYTAQYSPWLYGSEYWKSIVPPIVGAIVFILIGLYMMRAGMKKEKDKQTQLITQP